MVMRMREFEKLKYKIKQDGNICFALLFGSYARGEQNQNSDIDIALYFKRPPGGLELLDLVHEYSEYIGVEADIVVLNHASAFLRHQVLKHGIRLLIVDEIIYGVFREKTMIDYDMYKHVSGMSQFDAPLKKSNSDSL